MGSQGIAPESIEVLSFDCFGTLIDWESGLLASLRALLGGVEASDDQLLAAYGEQETTLEAGPWLPYREVLGRGLTAVCTAFGRQLDHAQVGALGGSVAFWPAFPDSAAALAALSGRYGLAVITNCDDDLFAAADERLGRPFRWVITAEQSRSYKPAQRNFELALDTIGVAPERVVHVAQSLFHDHVPAQEMGLRTIWVNRRAGREGFGATPPASATPDLVVPDLVVPDMRTLARVLAPA